MQQDTSFSCFENKPKNGSIRLALDCGPRSVEETYHHGKPWHALMDGFWNVAQCFFFFWPGECTQLKSKQTSSMRESAHYSDIFCSNLLDFFFFVVVQFSVKTTTRLIIFNASTVLALVIFFFNFYPRYLFVS